MLLGSEVFFKNPAWIKKVKNQRVGFLSHQASLMQDMSPTLTHLENHPDIQLTCLFSPQHGFNSVKQANMVTHEDSSLKNRPVFSLYSEKNRRLNKEMLDSFDVLLVEMQDVGCRIYTYLTTLFYILEDCELDKKTVIILDRPNPLGRFIEGSFLSENFHSFVGHAPLPMSHGLTLGELALWFKEKKQLKTALEIVPMEDHSTKNPWPLPWVPPSPNMTGLSCARSYPGTVLLEGTVLSEGRGTTLPLEVFGMPQMKTEKIKKEMEAAAPSFLEGSALRPHEFEPIFDKFSGKLCKGFQIHQHPLWAKEGTFRPYRLISLFLKCFHKIHGDTEWKNNPPYEYEFKKLPIDILSGNEKLKQWIENPNSSAKEWDEWLCEEENTWKQEIQDFLIYNQNK